MTRKDEKNEILIGAVRYQAVIRDQTELVCRWEPGGMLTFINDAYCRFLGKTREELVGKNFITFIPNEQRAEISKKLAGLTPEAHFVRYEVSVPLKPGQLRWHEWSSRAIFAEHNDLMEVQSVGRDITDRKESEEKYKHIIENTADGVGMIQDAKIIFVNDAFCHIFGYSEEELIDSSMLKIVHPDNHRMIKERYEKKMRGIDIPGRFVFKTLPKDGRELMVEISSSKSFTYKGKPTILGVFRDVTEQKRSEEVLEKVNKCFLKFGPDPEENMNRLVAVCGELLGSTCALYNRIDRDMLCSIGQWHIPEGYNSVDKAEGHICYDVIRGCSDDVLVIRDLLHTKYAETDPNVKQYQLQTYVGIAVKFGNMCIGSLCVVFQNDYILNSRDKKIMEIVASAIGIEEERLNAEDALRQSQERFRNMFENSPIALLEQDFSGVKLKFDELREEGVKDLVAYFEQYPETVSECISFIKVLDVNEAAVNLFGAKGKRGFWQGVSSFFTQESYVAALEELLAIAEGKTSFQDESVYQTFSGAKKHVYLKWSVVPGYENTYSKVLVSILDISDSKKAEIALKSSEEKFKNLAENSPNMIFINYNGKIVYVNARCEEVMGYTREELYSPGFNFLDLIAPESKRDIKLTLTRYVKGEAIEPREYGLLTKNKKKMDSLISTRLINYGGGKAILGIVTDVTKYNNACRELIERRKMEQMYLDLVGSIVVALNKRGEITLINKKGAEILGYKQDELIGKNWFHHFLPKSFRNSVYQVFKKLIAGKIGSVEYVDNAIYTKTGKERIISWHNAVLRDGSGNIQGTLSAGTDITLRKRSEEEKEALNKELARSNKRLRQLVLRDPQTGLYNHRYLIDAIESEFSRAKKEANSLSVMMLDLDYFKSVNDLYGHEFGDVVIIQFAKQLKKMMPSYYPVIRSGGEEFIIICPGTDKNMVLTLAEKILNAISLYNFGNNKHKVKLTLSIAVASYPEDKVRGGMDIINLADRIIDKAKTEGGNCVCLSDDLRGKKKPARKTRRDVESRNLKSRIEKLNKRSKQTIIESISAFAKTIDLKDHYTGEHVERTVYYATGIAKALGLSKQNIELIKQASVLHDLGKVGISDKILLKKAKLTVKEFAEIKKHPQIGADIIRPIQFLHDMIPLIVYHHERWDGSGYPNHLRGEDIPIGARIIALADAYQALISDRPYRKAFSKSKVIKLLKEEAGSKYDPKVVNIFLKILEKE